jgi:hypothetical protein
MTPLQVTPLRLASTFVGCIADVFAAGRRWVSMLGSDASSIGVPLFMVFFVASRRLACTWVMHFTSARLMVTTFVLTAGGCERNDAESRNT